MAESPDNLVPITSQGRSAAEQFGAEHNYELLTILFTDLVDSTKLQSDLGNVEAARLTDLHRKIVRDQLAKCNAREIEWSGDSCLAVFTMPSEGVTFALKLQVAMRNARRVEGNMPTMRIGLHLGEIFVRHHDEGGRHTEDLFGLQVSEAARVMSLARGDQIYCTRAVFDSARSSLKGQRFDGVKAIVWRNYGLFELKGSEDPAEVCEVGEEGLAPFTPPLANDKCRPIRGDLEKWRKRREKSEQPRRGIPAWALAVVGVAAIAIGLLIYRGTAPTPSHSTAPTEAPLITSLAVLPFENISSDPEQEYFVDGMTEALISELAKISALRVISRTSAMRYKGTDKPLPQIAKELGVEAIVEGSVFRAGNEVRITAQLIHGATDSHLWAENYVGTLENILKLQSEVALAIAEAIRITVTPEEETRIATKKPVDPEAYEAYLRGRFFFWKFTPDSFEKAAESFQRAVELDPGYAEAQCWLGAAHWTPSVFGFVPPAPAVARARPLIDKALALDDTFAFAHIMAGHIALTFDWDWARAEREFLRAIELTPGNPDGHLGLSQFYSSVGRFDDAIRILPTAINLDPFNFLYSSSLADQYLLAGRYEEAIAQRRKVLELEPAYLPALRNAPIDYRRLNRYDEAVEVIEGGIAIHGRLPVLVEHLVWAYAAAGRKVEAEVVLAELHAIDRDQYVAATTLVFAYAALGDMDEAFRWMDQAIEDHDYWLPFPYWPSWDLLRGDPRFIDMLRKINYPNITAFEAAIENAAVSTPEK